MGFVNASGARVDNFGGGTVSSGPTNTPTITNTPTRTPTASNTPTRTSTPTRTNTPTNTATASRTFTPSNTPTRTNTPPNTPTASRTSTPTNTATRTNTPTNTATNTFTPTFTPTVAPTSTLPPFTHADFTYDGDGKQVKAVVGSVTTYYVGAHYQVDNGVVTKFYFAGAQRVAMRKNGTLSYLLTDHLGSTSITANSSGALVSELRYKPWGETRYTSGTTPTTYQFTGQRNEASFGLYFYNARWYDSALGRFTSADSVVPAGAQGYDRYAYANNDPVKYTDPSGHMISEGDGGGGLSCKLLGTCPKPPQPVVVTSNPWNDPEYSEWYSGNYGGCTLCHYAHAQDKSILTNQELATADQNFREWFAVGNTPIVATTVAVGAPAIAQEAAPAVIITCLQNPLCAKVIGAGGGVTVLGKIKPGENPPSYVQISNQVNGRSLYTSAWTPELQQQFMEETKVLRQPVFLADDYTRYPGSVLHAEVSELLDSGWRLILNVIMYPPKK